MTDQFFDLPNTVKARYPFGEDYHGWVAVEQERWATMVFTNNVYFLVCS